MLWWLHAHICVVCWPFSLFPAFCCELFLHSVGEALSSIGYSFSDPFIGDKDSNVNPYFWVIIGDFSEQLLFAMDKWHLSVRRRVTWIQAKIINSPCTGDLRETGFSLPVRDHFRDRSFFLIDCLTTSLKRGLSAMNPVRVVEIFSSNRCRKWAWRFGGPIHQFLTTIVDRPLFTSHRQRSQ